MARVESSTVIVIFFIGTTTFLCCTHSIPYLYIIVNINTNKYTDGYQPSKTEYYQL